jgi:peptide/nickel transport system permease protein/oligopeptide transport system permease protein
MTLELAAVAMLISVLLGIPLGLTAARHPHTLTDYGIMAVAMIGVSIPGFWLGLILAYVFAVRWQLLPVSGAGTLAHILLPAVTLALYSVALLSRMTRASMLEVLSLDFVRTARAKGCSEKRMLVHHALRSALTPVVTVTGLQFGYLLSGAVVTETVFSWPGLGSLMADAVFRRDFPLIQGGVLLVAVSFVVINLLTDIVVAFADPRIRYE